MNKTKKPNTKKIRLSLANTKPIEINNEGRLSLKKSFDDSTLKKEKDEFWGDCLDADIKY
jgi:hypothetical protein